MIKIICVGKLKEKYLKDAILEYSKRFSKYTKLEIIELNDVNVGDVSSILQKEAEEIARYIDSKDYVITLEIGGKKLTSQELAKKIDSVFISYSNITFIIGGSYGLSEKIKNVSNMSLSFSDLTFPHQLFRVMLLEQIYRVFKINHHEEYHK